MKKRLLLALGLILGALPSWASTTTSRLGLTIPAFGDQNWDVQLRADATIIDTATACLGCVNIFSGLNTFNSTATFSGPVFVQPNFPIRLYDASTHYLQFTVPATVTTTNFVWPISDGSNGQFLSTDGSGHLSWGSVGTSLLTTNNTWLGTQTYNDSLFVHAGEIFTSAGQLTLNNADNSAATVIDNTGSTGQTQLFIGAGNGVGINSTPNNAWADLMIFGGSGDAYGRFAVEGSSANAAQTYSGFTSTNNVRQSTVWALPVADGTNGQCLTTDGATHLSWANAGGGSSASSLAVTAGVFRSSPTTDVIFPSSEFNGSKTGSTITVYLNTADVTHQGNNFKWNSQLFKLNPSGQLPAISGANLSGVVLNQNTLQSGATFYVSSGTVAGNLTVTDPAQSFGSIMLVPGNGATVPSLQASNGMKWTWNGGSDAVTFNSANVSSVPGPSIQATGVNLQANSLYLKQSNLGFNYSGFAASAAVTSSIWTLPNADTVGFWQSDGNRNLSITSSPTFTSETIGGTGAGAELWNEGADSTAFPQTAGKDSLWTSNTTHRFEATYNGVNSTFTILGTSTTATIGHFPVFLHTPGDLGDGGGTSTLPGGTVNSVQYNNAGVLTGNNNFQFNGTSVTVVSSMTINGASSGDNSAPGILDVFSKDNAIDSTILFSVGSVAVGDQFWVVNGAALFAKNGIDAGNLAVGDKPNGFPSAIHDTNSTTNQIIFNNGESNVGEMYFETQASTSAAIVMAPQTVGTVNISSNGFTMTQGYIQLYSRTHAQITAFIPKAVGEEYYCNDCSVVPTCISTGTVLGAWALSTSKTSACQ